MGSVRYSKGWAEWFTDTMIDESIEVKPLCEKYKDRCPSYRTVYRWQARYSEFDKMIVDARECIVHHWHDELEAISKEESPLFDDKMRLQAYQADKRARIDVLKFKISKVAPMITEKYKASNKQTVEHVNTGAPQIVIQSYAKPARSVNDDGKKK